ncbi:MAG TPA: hypothetical protein VK338_04485 [Candidatus Nitrosocosmicus sp.]|nr:hypothetical protein [Candidatus Nitrosocosmicus sp.]
MENLTTEGGRYIRTAVKFIIIGAFILYWGFVGLKRKRELDDIPESPIRGLAVGDIRIKGVTQKKHKGVLKATLSGKNCLAVDVNIQDYFIGYGAYGWRDIVRGATGQLFYIQDSTGRVLVDPNYAMIEGKPTYSFTCHPFKKVPEKITYILDMNGINEKASFFGIPLPFKRFLKINEYIVDDNSEVEIYGVAESNRTKKLVDKQTDKLIVVPTYITSAGAELFNSKLILLLIIGGIGLIATGIGTLAQSYNYIKSVQTLIIFIVISTFIVSMSIWRYLRGR